MGLHVTCPTCSARFSAAAEAIAADTGSCGIRLVATRCPSCAAETVWRCDDWPTYVEARRLLNIAHQLRTCGDLVGALGEEQARG